MKELFLYGRDNCHLCDEMFEQLQTLLEGTDVKCHVIKIDTDLELERRYGARLPVLVAKNRELCEIQLDVSAVSAYLGITD